MLGFENRVFASLLLISAIVIKKKQQQQQQQQKFDLPQTTNNNIPYGIIIITNNTQYADPPLPLQKKLVFTTQKVFPNKKSLVTQVFVTHCNARISK